MALLQRDSPTTIRQLLLGLVIFGGVGLVVELLLLDHTDSWEKWIPFVVLAITLIASVGIAVRPGRGMLRAFQGSMLLCVAAGTLGLYFHYRGNVEFELERDSTLHGLALFWDAIRGATPTLAPGALAQLGLMGLIYSYRHPVLEPRTPDASPRAR